MAKKLANDLGLKVIKLLPFQVLTQLPVGGLWGFFLPCCSYLFSVTSVLDTVCIPLQVLDDRTALNLVFPGGRLPHVSPPCLASLFWVWSAQEPQANCKSQSCRNTSRDDRRFFRTGSPVPSTRLVIMTNKTCAVAQNANLTSLLCIYSDPWRNEVMKLAQTRC